MSLGLTPQRDAVQRPGWPHLVRRVLDPATSAALLAALARHGLTLAHLADAAHVLATFGANAPLPPGAVHRELLLRDARLQPLA